MISSLNEGAAVGEVGHGDHHVAENAQLRTPWNKGRLIGQKRACRKRSGPYVSGFR